MLALSHMVASNVLGSVLHVCVSVAVSLPHKVCGDPAPTVCAAPPLPHYASSPTLPPPHHHHHHVCRGHQIFSSKAMSRGSFGYWALIVFVGTIITTAIVVMIALVIFESYRAFKFANLYDDIRWVACMCLRGTVSTVHRYLDFRL